MAKRALRVASAIGATLAFILLGLGAGAPVRAAGTAAGTTVSNTAQASFIMGGTTFGPISASVNFAVDELIGVDITLQTAGPVNTVPGATGELLTYLATNTGNGVDSFRLLSNSNLIGDQFDPIPAGIYLDTNGSGAYDAADPLYVPGVGDPTLDASNPATESILVFVFHDIPAAPAPNPGDSGQHELSAQSLTATGVPGTAVPGAGDGGSTAVVGLSTGIDSDIGTYLVSDTALSIVKTSTVSEPGGGIAPRPGATINYSIDVSVSGSDTAQSVVITDPTPTNTTYITNSIRLNGTPLTDIGGDDAADFNVTNPNTITVSLGDLTSVSPVQTITFQVQIN